MCKPEFIIYGKYPKLPQEVSYRISVVHKLGLDGVAW